MSEIPESKTPFDFYQSPWWKDMNNKLCADGWPQIVVALNCMIRDAKNDYEQLQKQNHELIKALKFYADSDNFQVEGVEECCSDSCYCVEYFPSSQFSEIGEKANETLAKYQKGDLK